MLYIKQVLILLLKYDYNFIIYAMYFQKIYR